MIWCFETNGHRPLSYLCAHQHMKTLKSSTQQSDHNPIVSECVQISAPPVLVTSQIGAVIPPRPSGYSRPISPPRSRERLTHCPGIVSPLLTTWEQ